LASVTPSGFTGGIAGLPSISANGHWVAFTRFKSPQGDTAPAFVRDTCLGAPAGCTPITVQVSVALDGSSGDKNSGDTAISADGRFVAFSSDATSLAPGDTNNKTDIFLARTGFNAPSSAASASPSAAAKSTISAADLKRGVTAREVSSSRVARSSGFDPGRGRSFTDRLLDLP
jgi:Tol biopolymer transport system component